MNSTMTILISLHMLSFCRYSAAKMSQIAYNLKSQNYSPRSIVARAGQQIKSVFLIASGMIKVINKLVSRPNHLEDEDAAGARSGDMNAPSTDIINKITRYPLYVR
jgi:signal-transduction protein with cAMP-binding, CBS, and nucleotidyltransferase domain